MLKKILIGLAAAVALLAIVIALQPSTFHIERSTTVAAPPANAFTLVNDFHSWRSWSPWEKLDPGMKRTYEGPATGAGAKYAWSGNDEVGSGTMTIERSDAPSLIGIKLEFFAPFAATNQTTFRFDPVPGGTKVTWAMDGTNNFMSKAFHLVMDMDKMVGADFERGLALLEKAAESAPNGNAEVSRTTP
jgi:hypothetical protein